MQKIKGVLLIEAVFSIFITFLCVLCLQLLMKNLINLKQHQTNADEIAFSYVQLQRFINEKSTLTYALPENSTSSKAVLCKEKLGKKKIYIIEQYKDMIRMTTIYSGHMPLLLDVKRVNFTTKDQLLKIKIEERDGRESSLYFKLDPRPKKKNEKKNEKDNSKKNQSNRLIK